MTEDQLHQYRDRLRVMAKRLGATVSDLEDQARAQTGGEAGGGLSNAPLHLADVGSEVYSQELGATLLENEMYIRDEVLAALDRIDLGTYGVCERCNRDIVPDRLDVLPYVRHCAPCASDVQSGRAVNLNEGRPNRWHDEPEAAPPTQSRSTGRTVGRDSGGTKDIHAAGTPGGGTAAGGLAGTNVGRGAPADVELENSMGGGDEADADEAVPRAFSGPSGGAVGGTPANKRAKGGKSEESPPKRSVPKPRKKKPE